MSSRTCRGVAAQAWVLARAALHSYSTVYSWSGVLFLAGCLITVLLYRRGRVVTDGVPAVHA